MPYSHTHATMVMYSLSESETLAGIRDWVEECSSHVQYENSTERANSYVWAIVGNKCDREIEFEDREEVETRARALSNVSHPLLAIISSTTGHNVRVFLKMLTEKLVDANSSLEQMETVITLSAQSHSTEQKKWCLWCFK